MKVRYTLSNQTIYESKYSLATSPAVPRVGESVDIDDTPYVVKAVRWLVESHVVIVVLG